MAIFNITSNVLGNGEILREFRTSNNNIHIDTIELEISEITITYQEWLGNF